MTLEEYTNKVHNYLSAKLPDTNPATLYEIAEFFVMTSNNFANDMIAENNQVWQKEFKRQNKWYNQLIEKVYKQT